jgi:hypothetical protein
VTVGGECGALWEIGTASSFHYGHDGKDLDTISPSFNGRRMLGFGSEQKHPPEDSTHRMETLQVELGAKRNLRRNVLCRCFGWSYLFYNALRIGMRTCDPATFLIAA